MKITLLLLAMFGVGMARVGASEEASSAKPRVRLKTTAGDIVIELDPERAPKTVENFLGYVESGHYAGTVFHRVIPGFMVQGGGFTADMSPKETDDTIRNEADNGLRNKRGTIAMARRGDPHSASAQFFINQADNGQLDHRDPSPMGWGYCVFGAVVEGMDVVDAIAAVKTGSRGPFRDVPLEAITIESATLEGAPEAEPAPDTE